MVDAAFNDYIDRYAEFEDVARPAKMGDHIRIRYKSVEIDGVDRPDLSDHCPEYPIELGGEGVFMEFDRHLVGMSAGGETEIGVKFPKDYADTGVAGKAGEFSIEVLSVQEKRQPELNEEFFQKIGGSTADALKGEIRKSIETRVLREAKQAAHEEAMQTLIKDNAIELAPSPVFSLAKKLLADHCRRHKLPETETTEEQNETFYGLAVTMLKQMKITDYVADRENIKATQEDVDREIMQMAQLYGQDFDTLKQMLRKDGTTNRIRMEIRERKTLDFLIGEGSES